MSWGHKSPHLLCLFLVSTSVTPRGVESLPVPLPCLCRLVSLNRAFRDGGWSGEGTGS